MVRTSCHLLLFIFLFSCAEPFDFGIQPTDITVIDGKVSTEQGQSYVAIYRMVNGDQIDQDGLEITILSNLGETVDFMYDATERVYLPQDPGFTGTIGLGYQLQVSLNGEILYRSDYDVIPDPVFFTIEARDTLISELVGPFNLLVDKKAVAAVANITQVINDVYAKLEFSYSYLDYFTNERIVVKNSDDFILFNNLNIDESQQAIDVPVGNKLITPWFFFDESRPPALCQSAAECGSDPCCGNPCCEYRATWLTEFNITQETMSSETYKFWENVEKLRNNDGLVFDTFPFPLKGNITCVQCDQEVVGLFRAVAETSNQIDVVL